MSTATDQTSERRPASLNVTVSNVGVAAISLVITTTYGVAASPGERVDKYSMSAQYNAGVVPIDAADYPLLAELWDNEDDAIFDTL